jgi:hypothetical protein
MLPPENIDELVTLLFLYLSQGYHRFWTRIGNCSCMAAYGVSHYYFVFFPFQSSPVPIYNCMITFIRYQLRFSCLFHLDIYCSLFIVNFFVNVPTVSTKNITISCPKGIIEIRDEEESKRRQRSAWGSLFPSG